MDKYELTRKLRNLKHWYYCHVLESHAWGPIQSQRVIDALAQFGKNHHLDWGECIHCGKVGYYR